MGGGWRMSRAFVSLAGGEVEQLGGGDGAGRKTIRGALIA
jgi:hypothetical protein